MAHVWCRSTCRRAAARITSASNASEATSWEHPFHPPDGASAAAGTAAMQGANWKLSSLEPVSLRLSPCHHYEHHHEEHELHKPGVRGVVEEQHPVQDPGKPLANMERGCPSAASAPWWVNLLDCRWSAHAGFSPAAERTSTLALAVRRWRRQTQANDFGQPMASTLRSGGSASCRRRDCLCRVWGEPNGCWN